MTIHNYHRGYGLRTLSIDSTMTNLLVNQGREIVAKLDWNICYGHSGRPSVEVPFRGHLSTANAYSRLVIKTGDNENQNVVLVLADHEKPFIQLTSSGDNLSFSKDVDIIRQLFASYINLKPHTFLKYPREYNDAQVQHFDNEISYSFTSGVDFMGQRCEPNHCLIGEVDRSVLNSFDFSRIKDMSSVLSISVGKGADFEDPYNHEDLSELYGLYISAGPIVEVRSKKHVLNLSVIVGSSVSLDEKNRSEDMDRVHDDLLALLNKYREDNTATAFGLKPIGTSKPYFMGPNTDVEKMIEEIIIMDTPPKVKSVGHYDTQVIKHMYYGLMRGDETCKKYATQLLQKAKKVNFELPNSIIKQRLSYTLSEIDERHTAS